MPRRDDSYCIARANESPEGTKRMKTPLFIGFFAVLALGACAQETPGSKAAAARHANFEKLGDAFKTLGDESKKPAPDAALMSQKAVEVADLAEALPTWFTAGSGPQDGVESRAKADIWTNELEFADKVKNLTLQTAEMRAAANDGAEALTAHIADVGAACKSCHDQFREPRN